MAERRSLPVPPGLDGLRADVGLAKLTGLSRTVVAGLIDDGEMRCDGAPLRRSERLVGGTWLDVAVPDPPAPLIVTAAEIPGMTIIHADDDIVVINKPVGVAAHPSPGWEGPTVLGGLAGMGITVARVGAAERHGIVHRLDVGTTGVMVVARSDRAYSALKDAFRQRTVRKIYHAVAQGHPDPTNGTIDAPIGRHPKGDYKFAVVAGGRDSVTHYETLEAFPRATLLEVHLETGRTHQIRVHFAALRHPLVGDRTYGSDPTVADWLGLTRQWLHARSLSFAHPATGELVTYTSDYPADLISALDMLRDV